MNILTLNIRHMQRKTKGILKTISICCCLHCRWVILPPHLNRIMTIISGKVLTLRLVVMVQRGKRIT